VSLLREERPRNDGQWTFTYQPSVGPTLTEALYLAVLSLALSLRGGLRRDSVESRRSNLIPECEIVSGEKHRPRNDGKVFV
jgi:hypothetical protein